MPYLESKGKGPNVNEKSAMTPMSIFSLLYLHNSSLAHFLMKQEQEMLRNAPILSVLLNGTIWDART
ncbi:hypothetical protein D9758_011891 [Tetrapyrgos nigripes]|uniref:Uncharacterized protein n=1 Tax=Tetrapyrgos nigripes TaxID=182062 RepID=A0A8H5CPU6_9AGAR|nr:hypothetical protein D9758_011891 [Tetrapyrgos nigripes]